MSELAKFIEESDEFWCGEGVDARKVLIYKIEMKRKGLPDMPEDFAAFLKECNGVRGSDSAIYAMNPDGPFDDVIEANLRAGMVGSGGIVLGYNAFEYLIYDAEDSVYQLRDKQDLELEEVFENFDDAAAEILEL